MPRKTGVWRTSESLKGKKGRDYFCVDHDHVTGNIRALLCGPCNSALARFGDNPVLCERAAEYIETDGFTDTGITSKPGRVRP